MTMLARIRRRVAGALRPRAAPSPRPVAPPPAAPLALALADEAQGAAERILVLADAMGATQQISFVAPLAQARSRGDVALTVVEEAALADVPFAQAPEVLAQLWDARRPTVAVISRAASRHVGALVDQCRRAGAPLVLHLDDDLFAVPQELGASKVARHNDPARIARLTIAARRADLIYASTAALAERLRARFPDKQVMGGEIYAAAQEPFAPFRPATPPVIGYMGTAGHAADLASIAPAIARVMDRRPDVAFETFGTIKPPKELARFAGRVRSHPKAETYAAFVERLKGLGWSVGLAPLLASDFNRCKADTKFVEYAQAGIPSVLADSPVYARPLRRAAAVGADAEAAWEAAIERLLDREIDPQQLVERAQQLLLDSYATPALEAQLWHVWRASALRTSDQVCEQA